MSVKFSKKLSATISLLLICGILSGCKETSLNSEELSIFVPATSTEHSTTVSEPVFEPAPPPPVLPKLDPDYEGFSKALDEAMEKNYVMGMSVAVFKDDEILYTYSNGYADEENKIPFTADTRSRVASVSKMITSMVMMTLYDKGLITPDSELSELTGLPFDAPGNKNKVKLWHLMSHTAGFYDTDAFRNDGVQDLNYLLKNSHRDYEPGTNYLYTNFGAGTAGAVIERLTDEFFFDYADECLFKPLGMDAGYNIEMISDKKSVAKLYDYYEDTVTDVQNWRRNKRFYSYIGKGNSCYCAQCELIINVKDLARLGMVMTNDGTLDNVRILSKNAVAEMEKRYFSTPYYDMGLSVRIYDELVEGRTIYGHNGIAFGAVTGLYYDPVDKTGVTIITNGCTPYSDETGFYKINKRSIDAAYKYVFDTGDFAKEKSENNSQTIGE